MSGLSVLFVIIFFASSVLGQTHFRELVNTELAFAKLASEKGTKEAFLEYAAPDGVLFLPEKVNARDYWQKRSDPQSLLSWAPNFADVSNNGIMGYTTGNWEIRPKGRDDEPAAFGQFVTIWLRQSDGKFRFPVDIGIAHPRPERFSTDIAGSDENKIQTNIRDVDSPSNPFFEMAAKQGSLSAYREYVADDVRMLREGKLPILGKKEVLKSLKAEKSDITFAKRSVFFATSDLGYIVNEYTEAKNGKTEKGNFLQIWKFHNGKWKIVLDIFKPVPAK